jgi:ubiquinol-cytochrome c reductase cytochrome c1 subunit
MRRLGLAALLGLALVGAGAVVAGPARAAEEIELPHEHWSFQGFFGTYDRAALQRVFQVYRDICANCHSLKLIAFRNLVGPDGIGLEEEAVKAMAAADEVPDLDDKGEPTTRPARLSDYIPPPFPNELAAKANNNGALPPDLSLMAKAREGGTDYIHALLTGYEEPPQGFALLENLNYNKYFPGHQIAMPPPLSDDGVKYADGTPATVDQMARDVSQFLTWTAEPKLENRKKTGVGVVLFLIVLTCMLYAVKRRVWAPLH